MWLRFPVGTATMLAIALVWLLPAVAFSDPNPLESENWKTDFSRHSVPMSEFRSGGPPKDGIPAIDDPEFITVAQETFLSQRDPVLALEFDGEARGYPLYVLMWHEIVNDEIAGRPVAVTFCPLCNAAIVFDAVLDGRRLDFGTTGRLRNSDLVMYDRQTESWWQQFSGEAIIGELTGRKLAKLPSAVMPFSAFKERYPDAKVLIPNDPGLRRYGQNPYRNYDTSSKPFLYSGEMPDGIEPMERVVVIEHEDKVSITTLRSVTEAGKIELDGFSLAWKSGMASALDDGVIAKGRDVGHVEVRDPEGKEIVHHVTFAFVAHAFHPDVPINGKES